VGVGWGISVCVCVCVCVCAACVCVCARACVCTLGPSSRVPLRPDRPTQWPRSCRPAPPRSPPRARTHTHTHTRPPLPLLGAPAARKSARLLDGPRVLRNRSLLSSSKRARVSGSLRSSPSAATSISTRTWGRGLGVGFRVDGLVLEVEPSKGVGNARGGRQAALDLRPRNQRRREGGGAGPCVRPPGAGWTARAWRARPRGGASAARGVACRARQGRGGGKASVNESRARPAGHRLPGATPSVARRQRPSPRRHHPTTAAVEHRTYATSSPRPSPGESGLSPVMSLPFFFLISLMKYSMTRWSKSSPPRCVSPLVAMTSNTPLSMVRMDTSNVPGGGR